MSTTWLASAPAFLIPKAQLRNKLTILAAGGGEDVLLHSVLADQPVDGHLLLLPNAMAARHRLQVILQQVAARLPQPDACSWWPAAL